MYTRVYRGKGQSLPDDYHGTAFVKEEEGQGPFEGENEMEATPAFEAKIAAPPTKEEVQEEKQREKRKEDGWQAELLLVSLCALLMECEEPDGRLLALLLLLLLSGNSS